MASLPALCKSANVPPTQVLALQAENEQLKIQEIEDRRRIQHLLALTQPVSQEVTFFRDCRPEQMTRPAAGSAAAPAGGSRAGGPSNRVLRTVYLPSDRADALALKLEALQRQLATEQAAASDRKAGWAAEAAAKEEAFKRKAEADASMIQSLSQQLETAQGQLRTAVAQHQRFKAKATQEATAAAESVAAAKKAQADAQEAAAATAAAASDEVATITAATQAELKAVRAWANASAASRSDDVRALQAQYDAVVEKYESKIASLTKSVSSWKGKAQRAERQRKLQLQGFSADVAEQRRALRQLETQWAMVGQVMGVQGGDFGMPAAAPGPEGTASAAIGHATYRPTHASAKHSSGRSAVAPGLATPGDQNERLSSLGLGHLRHVGVPPQKGGGKHAGKRSTASKRPKRSERSTAAVPKEAAAPPPGAAMFVGHSRAQDDVQGGGVPGEMWDAARLKAELARLQERTLSLAGDVADLRRA